MNIMGFIQSHICATREPEVCENFRDREFTKNSLDFQFPKLYMRHPGIEPGSPRFCFMNISSSTFSQRVVSFDYTLSGKVVSGKPGFSHIGNEVFYR